MFKYNFYMQNHFVLDLIFLHLQVALGNIYNNLNKPIETRSKKQKQQWCILKWLESIVVFYLLKNGRRGCGDIYFVVSYYF